MIVQGSEPTIAQMLSSPTFWFVTVLCGTVVSVLGSAAWVALSRWLDRSNHWLRKRRERRIAALVDQIGSSPHRVAHTRRRERILQHSTTICLMFMIGFGQIACLAWFVAVQKSSLAAAWLAVLSLATSHASAIKGTSLYRRLDTVSAALTAIAMRDDPAAPNSQPGPVPAPAAGMTLR